MTLAQLIASVAVVDSRDAALRHSLALHVCDALICLTAGSRIEEGRRLLQFYLSGNRSPEAQERAAAAAAVVRMSEYDPVHVPSCLTPSAIVIPIALTYAEDSDTLLQATAGGTAVGLWLARAIGGIAALERGVWPTLFAAPAMAAYTAGTCLGLSSGQLEHALALALAGSSGRLGRPSGFPSGRWFAIGEAVLKGIRAAHAAAEGFHGDRTLLAPDWLTAHGRTEAGAGDPLTDGASLSRIGLKPFVAARQGMNAIVAFQEIARGVQPPEIDRIVVRLPAECVPVVKRPLTMEDRLSRVANLGLRLGVAATDPEGLHDVNAGIRVPKLALQVASRVEIGVEEQAESDSEFTWPARVSVLAAGRWQHSCCRRCPGDASDSAAQEQTLLAKMERLAEPQLKGSLHALFSDLWHSRPNSLETATMIMHQPLENGIGTVG